MSSCVFSIVFHTLCAMEPCIMVALVTSGAVLVASFAPVKGGSICSSWDHGVGHRALTY